MVGYLGRCDDGVGEGGQQSALHGAAGGVVGAGRGEREQGQGGAGLAIRPATTAAVNNQVSFFVALIKQLPIKSNLDTFILI